MTFFYTTPLEERQKNDGVNKQTGYQRTELCWWIKNVIVNCIPLLNFHWGATWANHLPPFNSVHQLYILLSLHQLMSSLSCSMLQPNLISKGTSSNSLVYYKTATNIYIYLPRHHGCTCISLYIFQRGKRLRQSDSRPRCERSHTSQRVHTLFHSVRNPLCRCSPLHTVLCNLAEERGLCKWQGRKWNRFHKSCFWDTSWLHTG